MKRNFTMEPHFYDSEEGTADIQSTRAPSPKPSSEAMTSGKSLEAFSSKAESSERLQTPRAVSPGLSCVSMKSDRSIAKPPNLSCDAVASDPELQTPRAVSPGLSCVSMKSDRSIAKPPNLSCDAVASDPELQTPRAVSPGLSCVSMKSDRSIAKPPNLSCDAVASDPELQTPRAVSPGLSCVSMKSDRSITHPPDLSCDAAASDPEILNKASSVITALVNECVMDIRNKRLQEQTAASLSLSGLSMKSEQSSEDPPTFSSEAVVSVSKKSSISDTMVMRTGDLQQNPVQPGDEVLNRVLREHKTHMKNKHEFLFEGFRTPKNKTLLNAVYTQLYILEGEGEEMSEEHEILQMEKTPGKHLYDTPINCNDIFNQRFGEDGQDQVEKLKTVLTKGIAGIGKTVSVQKFILDWAEGKANQDVFFMFVFPFREINLIKDSQYSLHGLLCDFYPYLNDLDAKIYNIHKLVFIFDGLDESKIPLNFSNREMVSEVTMKSSVHVLMTNLIKGELLPSAQIWITSRPAAANQIPSEYINRVTEIQGFNDMQKEEYIRNRISDENQARKIISHIKTARSLHIMCHIPVFCWISATVLQQVCNAEIPKTLTEMYIHFLLFQMNIKEQKYGESCKSNPNKKFESDWEIILKLAELAYKQLLKGNVMFYEEDLKECGIDVAEASVYSGICTEIFREESMLHQRKVYCFVHLSFQEFLAAFYVFHCYVNKNFEELNFFKPEFKQWSENVPLEELLEGAVHTALQCKNGRLDLFLRFLLGVSLESNQKLLHGLLNHTENSSGSISKIIILIKNKIKSEDEMDIEMSVIMEIWKLVLEKIKQRKCLPADRSINLFLCLTEMNDQSLSREIQEYLKSDKCSEKKLSPGHCSALACMLLTSEEVLDELDLKKYNTSEEGYRRLIPAVRNCKKALLAGCDLTMDAWEILTPALQSANSSLIELDLSNNLVQDSGVELLSAGLKSSHCKLQILRLASCNLTTSSCDTLCSTLKSENSCLTELDIRNNNIQDSGVEKLSDGLKSSHCKLQILRLAGCNLSKYSCKHLCSALTSANSNLKELDLKSNDLQDSGVAWLKDGFKSSNCKLEILGLAGCTLSMNSCETICSALKSEYSFLKELDLSNNDLQDLGVSLLSEGLKSSQCKLEILRLSGCMVTEKSCSSLASALSLNPSHLKELDLSYNHLGESGVKVLSAMLKDKQCSLNTFRLAFCYLTVESCQNLVAVLYSANSSLKELDLSNNDLQDPGVEQLCVGLKSSQCKLEILRLSGCMVTEKGCSSLASALSSNSSYLKELDLTYNHPGESGMKLLSDRLEDPHCLLSTLRVEHSGNIRLNQGLNKYSCELTLDPNTAHTRLFLSDGNRKVVCEREQQSYPDHPERFDWWWQVLSRESMTGRCYWEVEWSGKIVIAVTYKSISRKGDSGDCQFGYNEKSWRLSCSNNSYSVWYNKKDIVVPVPSSSCNRVGVYVDCPAGSLSFYSVSSDTRTLTHLYTLNTTFTEPLYAGFRFYDTESSVCVCVTE